MNNVQENQLGMLLKVRLFMDERGAALAQQVPALADVLTEFNSRLTELLGKAAWLQEDITGVAARKAATREQLAQQALLLARALWAHALATGNAEQARSNEWQRTDFMQASDARLYTLGSRIYMLAQPLTAALAAFNVQPADVQALQNLLLDFMQQMEQPRTQLQTRRVQHEELQKMFRGLLNLLADKMDVYLSLFEFSQPEDYHLYSFARATDIRSKGRGHAYTGPVPAGATVPVLNMAYDEGRVYVLQNTGPAVLEFSLGHADGQQQSQPVTVPPGSRYVRPATDFSSPGPTLWVHNPGPVAGAYRVKLR